MLEPYGTPFFVRKHPCLYISIPSNDFHFSTAFFLSKKVIGTPVRKIFRKFLTAVKRRKARAAAFYPLEMFLVVANRKVSVTKAVIIAI